MGRNSILYSNRERKAFDIFCICGNIDFPRHVEMGPESLAGKRKTAHLYTVMLSGSNWRCGGGQ